ncbi:33354_t:CDS:2, partial [Racocetra persica]
MRFVYSSGIPETAVVKIGAIAATSLKQVIEYADIIFTSLANDDAINQIFDKLLSESELINDKKKKIIFIETSTIDLTTVGALREKNAQLAIITSGNQEAIDMLPLLVPVLGRKILFAGCDVKKAAKFKLIGNLFIFGAGELLSEGITLAEKTDVEKEAFMEFISSVFQQIFLCAM